MTPSEKHEKISFSERKKDTDPGRTQLGIQPGDRDVSGSGAPRGGRGRLVIIIAHRLSTIRQAGTIVFLKYGG